MRRAAKGAAVAFGLVLVLAGCGNGNGKDAQTDDALLSTSEGQDAATADSERTEAEPPPERQVEAVPEESPEPVEPEEPQEPEEPGDSEEPEEPEEPEGSAEPDPYDASTWDQDADAGLVRQHFAAVRNAFHESSRAGYTALAASTWPEHTARSFADCDYSGQFPGFDVTDEEQVVAEHRWSNFVAVPGWEIPTGGLPH
jgi:hypothetical protein